MSTSQTDTSSPAADDQYFDSPYTDYISGPHANAQLDYYKGVRYYVNHVLIPAVLAFGAVGNVVVLRRLSVARQQRPLRGGGLQSSAASLRAGTTQGRGDVGPWQRQPSERTSFIGLMALSVSDLLFLYSSKRSLPLYLPLAMMLTFGTNLQSFGP